MLDGEAALFDLKADSFNHVFSTLRGQARAPRLNGRFTTLGQRT
jgi:hypothetical protein